MNREEMDQVLNALTEELAALEHERWSYWQRYMHGKGIHQPDGSLVLPADLVARWERLMATEYSGLSDPEKESDREQVRRYLPRISATLADKMVAIEGIVKDRQI